MRQPSQSAQECGLPRSIVAEDDMKFSRAKIRGHAAQCGKAAELLDHVAGNNDRLGHGQSSRFTSAMSVPEFAPDAYCTGSEIKNRNHRWGEGAQGRYRLATRGRRSSRDEVNLI